MTHRPCLCSQCRRPPVELPDIRTALLFILTAVPAFVVLVSGILAIGA